MMKISVQIYRSLLSSLLLLLLVIIGCSKEQKFSPDLDGVDQKTIAIEVCFPGRSLVDNSSLRASTVAAQDYEQSLQAGSIFFYVFQDNGNGQPGLLKRIEPVSDLSSDLPEKGVVGKVFFRDNGRLHVVPTANLKLSKEERDKLLGMSFEEVSKTLITQPAGEPNWFPMAGEPVVVETNNLSSLSGSLRFNLERLSVRIDLVNETSAEQGGRFELTGARLREGNIDRSFLMKGQIPGLKVGDLKYGAKALSAEKWIELDPLKNSDPNAMRMQLYTYENQPGELWIEVKGLFEGQKAEFLLPFKPAPKRNTLYRVAIRNTKKTNVPFEDPTNPKVEPGIVALDWQEGGVATLEPTQDAAQPVITYFEASDAKGATSAKMHNAVFSNVNDVNTIERITLSTPNSYSMKLTLKSNGAEPMVLVQKAEVPWIQVETLGSAIVGTEGYYQDYLITFGENADLFPRTALLEIQNRYYADKINPRQISVEQPKATSTKNQLAYWAKANVDEINTFATEVTNENAASAEVKGKLYQWGRNIAFDPYNKPTFISYSGLLSGSESILWDNNSFIIYDGLLKYPAPFQGDLNDLVWSKFVNHATGAPAEYVGSNGGDPSPIGYRLPTILETNTIFPHIGGVAVFNKPFEKKATGVTVYARGKNAEVVVDDSFFSKGDFVLYAIRFVEESGEYITAFRYSYEGVRGLKVTARHLGVEGKGMDVKSIANDDFWANNAGSDVQRFFPATGLYFSLTDDSNYLLGIEGWFTTAERTRRPGFNGVSLSTGVTFPTGIYGLSIRPVLK